MKNSVAVNVYTAAGTAKGIATKKTKAEGKEYVVKAVDGGFAVVAAPVKKAKVKNDVILNGTFPLVKETDGFLFVTDTYGEKTFMLKKFVKGYKVTKGGDVDVAVTAKYAKNRPTLFPSLGA